MVADEAYFVDGKNDQQTAAAANPATPYMPQQYAQYVPDEDDPF